MIYKFFYDKERYTKKINIPHTDLESPLEAALRTIHQKDNLIYILQDQIKLLKQALYGKSSEKLKDDPSNARLLFNDAEEARDSQEEASANVEGDDVPVKPYKRRQGKRKPFPANLPRVRREFDLDVIEKMCKLHGTIMEKIGEKITEKLDIIPAKSQIIQEVVFQYKCSCCDEFKVSKKDLLDGFSGTIVSDGLKTYEALARELKFQIAGCMAHIRRKFWEAEKAGKRANAGESKTLAKDALLWIAQLYLIERDAKDKDPPEILAIRLEKSVPILAKFKAWLDKHLDQVLPKSLLGVAISYALGQWKKATLFAHNGWVPIDNNAVESAIRPFVIGRNNWLFEPRPYSSPKL